MQKGGRERGGIQTHVREDVRDFQKMGEIGVPGTAKLVTVALRSDFVRAPHHPGIFRGAILAQLLQQLVQARVQLALGAVAVKMEG